MESRRDQKNAEVHPEFIMAVITNVQGALTSREDIQVQQTLLRKFVDKVEIGNEKGRLWCTFPLRDLPGVKGLYMVPPRGFEPLSQA